MTPDRRRSDARVATRDPQQHQLTLRLGLALAVLVSLAAGLIRAG
jgi:hypothetical protein